MDISLEERALPGYHGPLTCKYQGTQEISQGQEKLVPSYFDFVLIQVIFWWAMSVTHKFWTWKHQSIFFIERAGA